MTIILHVIVIFYHIIPTTYIMDIDNCVGIDKSHSNDLLRNRQNIIIFKFQMTGGIVD